jgi:hypothetical protein
MRIARAAAHFRTFLPR